MNRITINKLPEVSLENERHLTRYINFINSRPERKLKQKGFHTHHIVPRSMSGSNDDYNLIELTSREHFIAHMILWKCGYQEMVCAFFFMSHSKRYDGRVNGRLYERLAHDHSEQTRKRLLGVPFTKEHKQNISFSHFGIVPSKETRNKLSIAQTGKKDSPETKKKKSESHMGEKNHMFGKSAYEFKTEEEMNEIRHKISLASSGSNNPMYGKSSLEFKTEEEILSIKIKKQNTWSNKKNKTRTFKGKYKVITNEIENKSILRSEEVPEGWRLGRKARSKEANIKSSESRKGSIYITNGIETKIIFKNEDQTIPEGWRRGRTIGK